MKAKKIFGTLFSVAASMAAGAAVGYKTAEKKVNETAQVEINNKQLRINKFYDYFQLVNHWLMLKNSGKALEQYFLDKQIKTIAIYGMGELGHRLAEELKDSSIEIKYAIDQKMDSVISDYEVVSIDSELKPVDAIIVTPLFDYYALAERLATVCEYNIISLEEVVFYLD